MSPALIPVISAAIAGVKSFTTSFHHFPLVLISYKTALSQEGRSNITPWTQELWQVMYAVAALGIASGLVTQVKGQVVFGSTDQVPWNILIVAYV